MMALLVGIRLGIKYQILTINTLIFAIVSAFISFYILIIGGVSISPLNFFNAVSPIKILYDEAPDPKMNAAVNFKFPFWKTFWVKGYNDLLIKKGSYPCFHNIVVQDFYVPNGVNSINKKKAIACVLKNLGLSHLIITKIGKIEFKKDSSIEPMTPSDFAPAGFKDLAEFLNQKIQKSPIILYSSEEIVLFRVLPDIYEELLTIEVEIEYADYLGEPNLAEYKNVRTYHQIDKVKFKADSPRVLHAEIKYPENNTSLIEKVGMYAKKIWYGIEGVLKRCGGGRASGLEHSKWRFSGGSRTLEIRAATVPPSP